MTQILIEKICKKFALRNANDQIGIICIEKCKRSFKSLHCEMTGFFPFRIQKILPQKKLDIQEKINIRMLLFRSMTLVSEPAL